ncbi:uncharacterized protein [Diadema setosum]|uniref:uncharacterized protein n=1 Tax=Diadema setosum TaxID=31175 RepID=UPI003B3AF957
MRQLLIWMLIYLAWGQIGVDTASLVDEPEFPVSDGDANIASITPVGIENFLGVGYDIIDGNPDGGDISNGGVDPGLKSTWPVFRLTYNDRVIEDGYLLPDQVVYSRRDSCVSQQYVFYGTQSYVEKLEEDVDREGTVRIVFGSFSKSKHYESVYVGANSQSHVYYEDKTVCSRAQARYRLETAEQESHPLDNGFVAFACDLPHVYNETMYMKFLQARGTHVVTAVHLGIKNIERYEETTEGFVHYAMEEVGSSVSTFANYKGYRSGVKVEMNEFRAGLQAGMKFGSKTYSYVAGSEDFHEPFRVTVREMDELFKPEYWALFDQYVAEGYCPHGWLGGLEQVRANIITALINYAVWREAQEASDPDPIAIPVTWPRGKYTLPKPVDGCPNSHFGWPEGRRYHDTEDKNSNNVWSSPNHLYGYKSSNNMEQWFCSKTVTEQDDYDWTFQPGKYCIMRKGGSCPLGMLEGNLHWDDEDDDNSNSHSGEMPDGGFGGNTDIRYCCRTDGEASNPIYLPTDDNFFLMKYNHQCQKVHGMRYTKEFFRWDNEDRNNADSEWGASPYEGVQGGGENICIWYCYYQPE